MRRLEFDELTVSKQYRSNQKPYSPKGLIAYDTETWKGKAILITNSKGEYLYPKSFTDCIKFLTRPKYYEYLGWFLNINYDVEAILKWLHEEPVRELAKQNELSHFITTYDRTKLKLIDKKMLILTRRKHNFQFYDIGNFYKGGLDKNAKKYLGLDKKHTDIDFDKVDEQFMRGPIMLERCLSDSYLTEQLANNFINTCNQFGIYTKNYCSPASLATSFFLSKCNVPTLSEISSGKKLRVRIAYEAYKGGFISTFKKGYFEKVWLYDINSAYPYNVSRLLDLRGGKIIFEKNKIPKDAELGWIRCTISIKDNGLYSPGYFNPVAVYLRRFNKNFYFTGTFDATIILDEYLELSKDFDIKIHEGFYWIPDEFVYIYKEQVERLYRLRQENKQDQNLDILLKTILNGYYGKLIQKIPFKKATEFEYKTGNLFNPFHASYITGGCRIQVYRFIKQYGADKLVAVMTDGVVMSEPVEIPNSKELGEWSLEMQGEGVFIGSGLYTIKNENKLKTAFRGFKVMTTEIDKDGNKKSKKIDFFKLLAENLDNDLIELSQKIRLTYREALRVRKFINWNILEDKLKKININCDTKRIWSRNFENCRDVLENVIDSVPISVNTGR